MVSRYSSRSPYFSTKQTNWYLGYFEPRRIPTNVTDDLIQVEAKYHERPDLLSYDLYHTVDFWWIFAARNMDDIKDPIYDLRAGMHIYVPNIDFLSSIIF